MRKIRGRKISAPKTYGKRTATCEFCGSKRAKFLFSCQDLDYFIPGVFDLFECESCHVVFQFPKPSRTQIKNAYPGEYISFNYRHNSLVSWILHFFSLSELLFIKKKFPGKTVSILDIGCGDGSTLLFYKKHMPSLELHGFELDLLKKDLVDPGIRCEFGSLDKFKKGSFDVVRMSQLIEHDPRAVSTLRKVHGLLKPGGYLVGETPNYKCLDFRIFKRFWGCLDMPRHIYLFSEEFMRRQLEKVGFADIKITYTPRAVGMTNGTLNFFKYGLLNKTGKYSPKPYDSFSAGRFILTCLAIPIELIQCSFGKSAGMKFKCKK